MAVDNESTSSQEARNLIAGNAEAMNKLQYMDEEPSFRPDKSRKSDVAIVMEIDAVVQELASLSNQDLIDGASKSVNNDANKKLSYSRRLKKHLSMAGTGPAITVEGVTPTGDEHEQQQEQERQIRSVLTHFHMSRKDKQKKKADSSQNDDINLKFLYPDWKPKPVKGDLTEEDIQLQQAVKEAQRNMHKYLLLLYALIFLFSLVLIPAIIFVLARAGVLKLHIDWLDLH